MVALPRLWTYHVLEMRKALLSGLPIQSDCACDSLEFGGASLSPERTSLFLFPSVFVSSRSSPPVCHELDDRPLTVWPVLVPAPWQASRASPKSYHLQTAFPL